MVCIWSQAFEAFMEAFSIAANYQKWFFPSCVISLKRSVISYLLGRIYEILPVCWSKFKIQTCFSRMTRTLKIPSFYSLKMQLYEEQQGHHLSNSMVYKYLANSNSSALLFFWFCFFGEHFKIYQINLTWLWGMEGFTL